MEKSIDNEKNESFLEILNLDNDLNQNIEQKILFPTTDAWLAQLGQKKND